MTQPEDDISTFQALDRLRDEILVARYKGLPLDEETETLIAAIRAYRIPYANPKDFKVALKPYVPLKVKHVLTKRGPGRRKALDALIKDLETEPPVPEHLLRR